MERDKVRQALSYVLLVDQSCDSLTDGQLSDLLNHFHSFLLGSSTVVPCSLPPLSLSPAVLTLKAGSPLVVHGPRPAHQRTRTAGGEVSVVGGEAAGAGAGEEGVAPTVESHCLVTLGPALTSKSLPRTLNLINLTSRADSAVRSMSA